MRNITTHIFAKSTLIRCLGTVLLTGALMTATAQRAQAQCEFPGVATAASAVALAAQVAAVTVMTTTILTAYELETNTARGAVVEFMNAEWELILDRLNKFYEDWEEAMKGQTAQLHAGQIDQTRQMSTNYDVSDMGETARRVQEEEYKAKKEYVTTDEGCRFDTVAHYSNTARGLKKAMVAGIATEFNDVGNNKTGGVSETGAANVTRVRYDNYLTKFCDGNSNGGKADCPAGLPMANAHILPSKLLFAKETIDMSDADTRDAINQLLYNITGFRVPDPMPEGTLESAAGKAARIQNRENLAQMDAINALASSIVAERTKGKPAPEIKAMRTKFGVTNASDNPSEREIRQAVVEQLWDPNYYANLIDGSATTAQKQLYLQAYSLDLLYKLIEKTEKIATAYAIETANLLDKTDTSRAKFSIAGKAK